MATEVMLDPTRLVIAAILGLVILLVLIIRFKVQAMIAILVGAICIGLIAGMPTSLIVTAVNDGIGNTLKGIALLVGLGSMFGAILEISGGAQTLAVTMVRKFGDEKAAWALGITGMVIAMPVFFDAGLIILIPLAFSLAKRTNRSTLFYAIPLLAGLAVGHAFIPPTPGPVLVATMLNVDLGWVILVGIFCGAAAMIVAGPIFGAYCGKKYMVPVPDRIGTQEEIDESKLPSFWSIVGIIFIPLILIIFKSVVGVIPSLSGIQPVFDFLGEPFVALLIATIAAMFILGIRHGYSMEELEKIMTKSLEPTGLILLVTACGGVLRYMLQYSGLGDVIGNAVSSLNVPLVLLAFHCGGAGARQRRLGDGRHDDGGGHCGGAPRRERNVPDVSGVHGRGGRGRLYGVLPLQRLRFLAGQVAGGNGRKDHPQNVDDYGNAGRLYGIRRRADYLVFRLKGAFVNERADQSETAENRAGA